MLYAFRSAALAAVWSLLAIHAQAADPAAVAARVDQTLASELPDRPAVPRVDDQTYLRRVSLDLIGRNPTPEEITRFTLDPSPDKRAKLVERLLADERYGVNWGRYWRDVIMYRRTEERALIAQASLEEFLTTELNKNTSWSQIATAFITATGDVQENGATGLIVAQQGRPEETVSEISRIFLGVQIQCAQCHDHPTDRWKREQFHELAAFFPRVAARLNVQQRTMTVTATDFPLRRQGSFNGMRFRGTPEHYMPDLNDPSARGKLMTPVFFATGDKLPFGTRDADRRGELAKWLTQPSNPFFAKALVNRMWSELCGEGFYEPVDDIGPDRTCTAPQTINYLAEQFAEHDYDLKWLLRVVTATDLYQRQSRPRRAPDDAPMGANVAQRLRADTLYDNLLAALSVEEPASRGGAGPYGFARSPRRLFGTVFGYDPSERRDELAGSIPQTLAMMNSPSVNQAISASRPSYGLGKLLRTIPDDRALVLELYLRTLAREPSPRETDVCLAYLKESGNRGEAFEDLQWSLLNSTEFLYRP